MAAQLDYAPPERVRFVCRDTCRDCHGSGGQRDAQHRRQYRAVCARCDATWSAGDLAAHLDGAYGGWFGYRVPLIGDILWQTFATLPCGCYLWHLRYTPEPCQTCAGRGYRERPPTFHELYTALGIAAPAQARAVYDPPVPPLTRNTSF